MLVGRLVKDSSEVRRVIVNFPMWLDAAEVIASFTVPVLAVEQNATWQCGAYVVTPPPPPVDTTPLTLVSSAIVAGTDADGNAVAAGAVQLMLAVGTPGLTYKVTFDATGSTSARVKQVDILVTVRMPI